jgi:hypothetical protein
MRPLRTLLQFVGVFITLCLAAVISWIVVPIKIDPIPGALKWWAVGTAVSTCALAYAGVRAEAANNWRGWKLAAGLALLPAVVNTADLLEGVIFLKNLHLPWARVLAQGWIAALVSVPAFWLIFRSKAQADVRQEYLRSPLGIAWRVVAGPALYLVLYFTAGLIIFPLVADFYATQSVPSGLAIVGLQLLVRGPVFVALCVMLTRMMDVRSFTGALTIGLVFTTISGIAPLIVPNPYFPDAVRWVHFCEVVSSNFVFATLVAMMWRPQPASCPVADQKELTPA